jgi:hypothetical protein
LGAAQYPALIRSPDDVRKIRDPVIRADPAATEAKLAALRHALGVSIRVALRVGVVPALWDLLVQWYGTNELMEDLVENPELVHAAAERTCQAALARARALEAQGLLRANAINDGGGGFQYCGELPGPGHAAPVRLNQLWGNQMAQIFAGVSAEMHDEFALRYEIRLLDLFGLNCYGCCEPLHHKVHLLHKIPRLRRISMSPWVEWEKGAGAIGTRYIFSAKPNPAHLAGDVWDPAPVRRELRRILEATRGLRVELVLKDLHTLRGEPQRLVAWERLAAETIEECAR